MVKQHELQRVFSRLAGVGFSFNAPPDDLLSPASEISRSLSITSPALAKLQDETGPPSPFALPNPAMDGPPGSGSRTRRPAPPGRIRSSTAVSSNFSGSTGSPSRTGMGGSVSLSGSIVLSDRGSTSSTPGTPSRADRAEGVTMSRTGTQEIPALAGSNGSILPEEDLKRGRTRSRATAPILEGETFEAPVVVPSVRDSPSAASSKSSDSSMEDALLKAITILPDELICVGLDLAYETSWMTAITKLLLFPGDLESAEEPDEEVDEVDAQEVPKWAGDKSIEATGGSTFTIRDSIVGSLSRRGSTTTAPPPPKGFVSLTQTSAEASLTADLGLLRTLFAEDEDNVVLTVGKGGLRGRWMGESEGEEDWEDAVEQGRTLRSCLQLDLSNDSSFGLGTLARLLRSFVVLISRADRHGVVDMLSDRLLSESIPLLYTSTCTSLLAQSSGTHTDSFQQSRPPMCSSRRPTCTGPVGRSRIAPLLCLCDPTLSWLASAPRNNSGKRKSIIVFCDTCLARGISCIETAFVRGTGEKGILAATIQTCVTQTTSRDA